MPRRPENTETVQLALELLKRIPKTHKVTARELYDELAETPYARDLRTIQRQLETLSEHFEIDRDDRSKPYGYQWRKSAKGFSVPGLTEPEALLLALAQQYLKNLLPPTLMSSMEAFFKQATRNISHNENAKREREWMKKVRIVSTTQPLIPPEISPDIFSAVSTALYENCWLELTYRNAQGVETSADVKPLGLAQQGPRLYLVCRFKGFDNERSLALHRILSARVTTLTFARPSDFDLQKYDDDGRFGFGEGKRIVLKFRISKEAGLHLLESPLSQDQKVTETKTDYVITATVVETAQLDWWLRGFGDVVQIISKKPTTKQEEFNAN